MKRKNALNKKVSAFFLVLLLLLAAAGCGKTAGRETLFSSAGDCWRIGFAAREIRLPETDGPLYIAGYKNGVKIEGVRDLPRASALWLSAGEGGILLVGIDCVALSCDTIADIRTALGDLCRKTGCAAVNVFATHTHESADTLGLWGPVGFDGKNPDFMRELKEAAVEAAKAAYENTREGQLYYGEREAGSLLLDSREPQVFDNALRQLRFVPAEGGNGVRLLFFPAHAESMRSGNTLVSRDYPGVLSDTVKQRCGDDVLFVPGAVGGLIMTRELTKGRFDAEENVLLTGEAVAELALSIDPAEEARIAPEMRFAAKEITIPLDNTLFMYYRFLGVLRSRIVRGDGATGYAIVSTMGLLRLGNVGIALLPGEIFPELVYGEGLGPGDPEPLADTAEKVGIGTLLIAGLCNDEIGYVIPPSSYLVNEKLPYIDTVKDETGENHYEETNSVGPKAAEALAEGFRKLAERTK